VYARICVCLPACLCLPVCLPVYRLPEAGWEGRAHTREWTVTEKAKNSDSCKNKGRLSLAEKLQIIRLYQEVPLHERKS
jgi:hypothetical protein